MNIFNSIISEGCLCFDVGANIGNKTEMMVQLGATVVSIEPQVNCFHALLERFKNSDKVICVKKACSTSVGTDTMYISSANTLSTMSETFIRTTSKERFSGISWNSKEEIETTTLDSMIQEYGMPKFCKIDVEGYESEVLRGLTSPIPYVSVEFTPELKDNTYECMRLLCNIGDYEFNYSEGESHQYSFTEWLSFDDMKTFLDSNTDYRVSFGDLYARVR